jgi:hypothetical protein
MNHCRGSVGKRAGCSYLDLLFAPVWVLALMLISDWLTLEVIATVALSFIAWLYVRRR